MADDEPEVETAEVEETGDGAPEPIEEVEMSVLDALKEVRLSCARCQQQAKHCLVKRLIIPGHVK